jgi:crossover junction endodeoxyribonuclease RuvC
MPPAPPVRRILGVDPGTRVAGWALVEVAGNRSRLVACGVMRMRAEGMAGRLLEFGAALRTVIREQSPNAIAVETQFFGKGAPAAFAVGMSRGVALFVAAESDVAVHEYTPATVKKAVVGNGNASKEQVAAMVRVLLGLAETPKPADVTDAIAIALAHAHRGGTASRAV